MVNDPTRGPAPELRAGPGPDPDWEVACELARSLLAALVRIESPSSDPEAVGRAMEAYARALEAEGVRVRHEPTGGGAPILVGDFGDPGKGAPLLVVGHLDTVHPHGTLAGPLPLEEREGRLHGPGIYDMKGGLAVVVGALHLMRLRGRGPRLPLRILVTPDEEVGAPSSRAFLEAQADGAAGALVLEPPLPDGSPKVQRKGVGEFRIVLHGRPAHAGIEPERGASAIHALGALLPGLLALARPEAGTTLNVGRVVGGGPVNVVADRVELAVDVRVTTMEEKARVEAGVRALASPAPGVRVEVEGGVDRPPMERTPGGDRLLDQARQVARVLGVEPFEGGATGGGSDGNLLAARDCPVLDGLGPRGDGAHTLEEHVELEDLRWRVAFLADLLEVLE
jgi:glutamate carboxypeptidase